MATVWHRSGLPLAALASLILVACSAAPRSAPVEPGAAAPPPAALPAMTPALLAFRGAIEQFAAARYSEAAAGCARVVLADPQDDVAVYLAAVASLRNGDREAALTWLRRLDELGSDLVPGAKSFAAIVDDPRFTQFVAAAQQRADALSHGVRVAFEIDEPGLLPEGIAFDAASRSFLVGSIRRRKIVRVRDGAVEDFAPASRRLDAVLGVRVDPARQIVWAATEADANQDGYRPDDAGRSALVAFDAATGATRARFAAPAGKHLFNDIAIGPDGTAYVTDSETGGVWSIAPGDAALTAVLPAGTLVGPNGIAWDDVAHALLVADEVTVWRVDPRRGVLGPLAAHGMSLAGLDGMYLVGSSLIGVQNIAGPGRVVVFALDGRHAGVISRRVIASAMPMFAAPTTGAIADDSLYLIANSANGEPPAPTIVLRVPLSPAE